MRADLDQFQLARLARSDEVRDLMDLAGESMTQHARNLAPGGRTNQASREGIDHEEVIGPDGWESHVGHVVGEYGFWLRLEEFGTKFHTAQPHLRPASTMRVKL